MIILQWEHRFLDRVAIQLINKKLKIKFNKSLISKQNTMLKQLKMIVYINLEWIQFGLDLVMRLLY